MDFGLLLLRIAVGVVLIRHGTRKLSGWFGAGGLSGTSSHLRLLGYWPPRPMAAFAGGAELFAGLGLGLGFATPVATAVLIGTMLNAAVAAHGRNGPWPVDNGSEYPLLLGTAAATVAFTGPGAASLDAWLGFGDPTLESAAFAVALGLITGMAVLVSRAAHSAVDTTTPEAAPDDLAA